MKTEPVTEENPLALSQAYATKQEVGEDNNWYVYDRSGNEIGKLPFSWTPKDCMTAIRLGRECELVAFNRGIRLGEEKAHKQDAAKIKHFQDQVKQLAALNERLSEALERHIIGEEEI